jgi:phosphatidylglycerophosphatase A
LVARAAQVASYGLATWFGCGFVPKLPGTVGTVGAIPLYLVLRPFGPWACLAAAVILAVGGAVAAARVVDDRRDPDPQIVVVDEVAGVLVTLAAAPPTWPALAAGFVLFRILDQWKPWPAGPAERLPKGWGVIADDLVAGVYGALVLLAFRFWGIL